SALWAYMRDRLARLYGGIDPAWATKARSDFSTAGLTPESVADPVADQDVDIEDEEAWEPELPAWASLAVANATATLERRRAPPQPKSAQALRPDPQAQAADRNLLDRRKSDRGPPPGAVDRRQSRSFGRRPTH